MGTEVVTVVPGTLYGEPNPTISLVAKPHADPFVGLFDHYQVRALLCSFQNPMLTLSRPCPASDCM